MLRSPGDRLVDDVFAALLCGEAEEAETTQPTASSRSVAASVVVDRVFDASLLGAAALGARQAVVLGAGGCTRALRLAWPAGTRVFEVAPFDAVAHAELALARGGCAPARGVLARRVSRDTAAGWAQPLLAAGFLSDRTSAWAVLLEGTEGSSGEGDANELLESVGNFSAVGSSLVCAALSASPLLAGGVGRLAQALARAGFRLDGAEALADVATSLGRTLAVDGDGGGGGGSGGGGAGHEGAPSWLLFSATKTRLSGAQADALRSELHRAEDEGGEEGWADAPAG